MAANVISGKEVAADVRAAVKDAVATLPGQPTLAVVLVGEDPASQVYVRNKVRQTEECGMRSLHHHLPVDATQEQVESLIS
ncbi:MAG: tetrahydrofolate dehydrogenase/cyclohydrolase catalytic domain-containing protein, partial [Pseudomonadota bacterium]